MEEKTNVTDIIKWVKRSFYGLSLLVPFITDYFSNLIASIKLDLLDYIVLAVAVGVVLILTRIFYKGFDEIASLVYLILGYLVLQNLTQTVKAEVVAGTASEDVRMRIFLLVTFVSFVSLIFYSFTASGKRVIYKFKLEKAKKRRADNDALVMQTKANDPSYEPQESMIMVVDKVGTLERIKIFSIIFAVLSLGAGGAAMFIVPNIMTCSYGETFHNWIVCNVVFIIIDIMGEFAEPAEYHR